MDTEELHECRTTAGNELQYAILSLFYNIICCRHRLVTVRFAKKFAKPATNQSHSHQAAKVCCAKIQPRKESMQLLGEKMNYRQWRRPSSRKWENISSNPLTILIKTPVKDLWLEFCNTPFLERPTGINLQHDWQAWLSLGSAFSTTTNHPVPT